MNCKDTEKISIRYIEGNLTNNEFLTFYAHLNECAKCMDEFIMNYAIYTALSQLEKGDELSDNYRIEAEERLKQDYSRIMRHNFRLHFAKGLVILILTFIGLFLGFTNSNSFAPNHLPETEYTSWSLGYYGIDSRRDPVEKAIREYNSELIRFMHEKEKGD